MDWYDSANIFESICSRILWCIQNGLIFRISMEQNDTISVYWYAFEFFYFCSFDDSMYCLFWFCCDDFAIFVSWCWFLQNSHRAIFYFDDEFIECWLYYTQIVSVCCSSDLFLPFYPNDELIVSMTTLRSFWKCMWLIHNFSSIPSADCDCKWMWQSWFKLEWMHSCYYI